MSNKGHIYILQEREFIKTGENIYKIGYTCQENVQTRIKQYPKGSKLLYHESVETPKKKEKDIINLLTNNHILRKDIGREYFQGNLVDILADINSVLQGIKKDIKKDNKKNIRKDPIKGKIADPFDGLNFMTDDEFDENTMEYDRFVRIKEATNQLLIDMKLLELQGFEGFKYRTALEELTHYNIFKEYKALDKILNDPNFNSNYDSKQKLYKRARFNILDYIITCVRNDHNNGNYFDEKNNKKIVDAGKMLWEEGGEKSMRDLLVWSFIPKRYHREIDYMWNGIGTWRA